MNSCRNTDSNRPLTLLYNSMRQSKGKTDMSTFTLNMKHVELHVHRRGTDTPFVTATLKL